MKEQPELYAEAVALAQGRLPMAHATPDHFEAVLMVLRACRASHLELQQTLMWLCRSRRTTGGYHEDVPPVVSH